MGEEEGFVATLVGSVPLPIERVSMSGGQLVTAGPDWFFGTALSSFRVVDANGHLLFTDLDWELPERMDKMPLSALCGQSVVEVHPRVRRCVCDIELVLGNGVRILVFDTNYPDCFLASVGGVMW